jgi:hypothetical protein
MRFLSRLYLAIPWLSLLAGCGYGSSPGVLVASRGYEFPNHSQIDVSRHLDDWRASMFKVNWIIVKCTHGGQTDVLFKDVVAEYPLFGSIPPARVRLLPNGYGYAFFNSLIVFDQNCKKMSATDSVRLNLPRSKFESDDGGFHFNDVSFNENGIGHAHLIWRANGTSYFDECIDTENWGVNWLYRGTKIDITEDIKVLDIREPLSPEMNIKLEKSKYLVGSWYHIDVIENGVSPSVKFLSDAQINNLVLNCFYIFGAGPLGEHSRVVVQEFPDYLEVIFAVPTLNDERPFDYRTYRSIKIKKNGYAIKKYLTTRNALYLPRFRRHPDKGQNREP